MRKQLTGHLLRRQVFNHAVPLLFFAVLSIALTWPTVANFTTRIVSDGVDARHNLWLLWHVRQAVLGEQPFFSSPLLYYPLGASLLTHGVGPVVGLFALPFWPWGGEAAYNGAVLVGFWLTGYSMYLLARTLYFGRGVALFAGTMLMASEMTLAGLYGHIEKSFLAFLPLSLLAALHTFNARRSRWWAVATAVVLLFTLLHAGWHFVLAGFAVAYFALTAWTTAVPQDRMWLLQRIALLAVSTLVLVGPLLFAIQAAANHPALVVDLNLESFNYRPDLFEFLLPSRFGRLFGAQTKHFLSAYNVSWTIESTVSLARTGIFLSLLALVYGTAAARHWLWFVLLCILLALGPSLKVLGTERFTEYRLPIILPYSFLTALPGLDFMRKSGQFMALGYVGFGIAASFGLAWLTRCLSRYSRFIIALAIGLVLLESWPQPWPQEALRPVPSFYRRIAQDDTVYGVFDLPIQPSPSQWHVGYSSHYQMYQMVHGKGIAAGYLSRTYASHPLFPCLFSSEAIQPDVLVDGEPVNCYTGAKVQLAQQGYRYIVWHKPQAGYQEYRPGSWGEEQAEAFVEAALGDQPPMLEDDLTRVYELPPADTALPTEPVMVPDAGWYQREGNWRWAFSPAILEIIASHVQPALLEITPHSFHDPRRIDGLGLTGKLIVQTDTDVNEVSAVAGETVVVPTTLRPGTQTVTISLSAGNFYSTDYGGSDPRPLSFSIRSLNLRLLNAAEAAGEPEPPE